MDITRHCSMMGSYELVYCGKLARGVISEPDVVDLTFKIKDNNNAQLDYLKRHGSSLYFNAFLFTFLCVQTK